MINYSLGEDTIHNSFLDSIRLNKYNVPTDNMEVGMFAYMTVQEAAIKWNISERRIQTLCSENKIEGIVRLRRVWLIPKDAKKPADGRFKVNRKRTELKHCEKDISNGR